MKEHSYDQAFSDSVHSHVCPRMVPDTGRAKACFDCSRSDSFQDQQSVPRYEETDFSKFAESVGKSNGTPLSTPPYVTEPGTASTYMYWKIISKSLCYSHRTG